MRAFQYLSSVAPSAGGDVSIVRLMPTNRAYALGVVCTLTPFFSFVHGQLVKGQRASASNVVASPNEPRARQGPEEDMGNAVSVNVTFEMTCGSNVVLRADAVLLVGFFHNRSSCSFSSAFFRVRAVFPRHLQRRILHFLCNLAICVRSAWRVLCRDLSACPMCQVSQLILGRWHPGCDEGAGCGFERCTHPVMARRSGLLQASALPGGTTVGTLSS